MFSVKLFTIGTNDIISLGTYNTLMHILCTIYIPAVKQLTGPLYSTNMRTMLAIRATIIQPARVVTIFPIKSLSCGNTKWTMATSSKQAIAMAWQIGFTILRITKSESVHGDGICGVQMTATCAFMSGRSMSMTCEKY